MSLFRYSICIYDGGKVMRGMMHARRFGVGAIVIVMMVAFFVGTMVPGDVLAAGKKSGQTSTSGSLYDRIGGQTAVDNIAGNFVNIMMAGGNWSGPTMANQTGTETGMSGTGMGSSGNSGMMGSDSMAPHYGTMDSSHMGTPGTMGNTGTMGGTGMGNDQTGISSPNVVHNMATGEVTTLRTALADRICEATGGPCKAKTADLKNKIAISPDEWNQSLTSLRSSLKSYNLSSTDENKLVSIVSGLRRDFVNSSSPGMQNTPKPGSQGGTGTY
jgi:hypothetical protein